MQTVYYSTSNYIRHTGNLVDLTEYRRRLGRTAVPEMPAAVPEPPQFAQKSRRNRRSRFTSALLLDCCASAAILVMTVTVVIQVLIM